MTTADGVDRTSVVLVQEIGAPPDVVFEYFVDPARMLRWMGADAELDPRPGGRFWLDLNGTDRASGSYVEIDRPRRLVFTWGWEQSDEVPPGSTTVTVTLEGDADSTVLELRHDGLPPAQVDAHSDGWARFVPNLAAVVNESD